MLKTTTPQDIIQKFKKGERDFSNVKLVGGDFNGLNLEGIIFRNSVLISPTFFHANFTNADFSGAKLEFCSFYSANLKNATFQNARVEAANFIEAKLENTNFDNTELFWVVFFDSNYSAANLKNAKLIKVFFTMSEMNESDIEEGIRLFGEKAKKLPAGRLMQLKGGTEAFKERISSLHLRYGKGFAQSKNMYLQTSGIYVKPTTFTQEYTSQLRDVVYKLFGAYEPKKKYK